MARLARLGHVHWFSASTTSEAVVDAERARLWDVLTDPAALAELTPMLSSVEADGDLWRWQMVKVPVLGASLTPAFTERMVMVEHERIDFTHAPPAGADERAGVDGWYTLTDTDRGTHLATSLTVRVQLPLARVAAPAVTTAMRTVLATMGHGFARNLVRRLEA